MNRYLLLPLIRRFDRIHEYIFLMTIGWCLGIAQFAHWMGLSAEIGAFIAGVVLASSPISMFIAESLKPLRDFFLVLFFFSLGAGFDVILEIDWQGAAQVRKRIPDAVSVFILPPSVEALRERLSGRGQDSEEIIQRRMHQAQNELSHYPEYDYLVFNDDFDLALAELQAIFVANRLKQGRVASERTENLRALLA